MPEPQSKPFAVVFAGTPGTSKSIIAFYLSQNFDLPIFNNDNLRFEVREDLLADSINIPHVLKEYNRRFAERHKQILDRGRPIIFDGSVDRQWRQLKQQLIDAGYEYFMIDMELSEDFQRNLFAKTGRHKAIDELKHYMAQHRDFLRHYEPDISLKITDETFARRLKLSAAGLQEFLSGQTQRSKLK